MKKLFFIVFLFFMLLPISYSFSQKTDTLPTLSVILTSDSPFVYKDDEGYTVVVGSVKNTNNIASVANIHIRVNFYDDIGTNPLEVVDGKPLLEVIPPLGQSPYILKSKSPDPNITQASLSIQGFNSSPSKSKQLNVTIDNIVLDETLHFSGTLKTGASKTNNANVYLAFYDAFQPARIVKVSTIHIGDLEANAVTNFNFDEPHTPRSVGFLLFSESNIFYSDMIDIKIPTPVLSTKLVTISNVLINDLKGNKLSEIQTGSIVNIQSESWIKFSTDQKSNETPYRYYIQIKQSGVPYVEFLGKYDGRYIGAGKQLQSIDWVPTNPGLFYIETFVWDRNNIPIADPGPIAILIVN